MKQQVCAIHGGDSYDNYEDYLRVLATTPLERLAPVARQRWLADSLRPALGEGYEVFTPTMPNSKNARYVEWKIYFERHFELFRPGIILVGHSLGGSFLAKYLSENEFPQPIGGLFLIAPAYEMIDDGGPNCTEFAFDPHRGPALAAAVPLIELWHSTDDQILPFAHAEQFKAAVPSLTLRRFEDRGHFIDPEFPDLVAKIKGLG